jgi:hypothetical protein
MILVNWKNIQHILRFFGMRFCAAAHAWKNASSLARAGAGNLPVIRLCGTDFNKVPWVCIFALENG